MTSFLNTERAAVAAVLEQSARMVITNTLLITQLAPESFTGHSLVKLRATVESLARGAPSATSNPGDKVTDCIHQFIPLRSFRRVMVVLRRESDAMRVKLTFDRTTWGGHPVRVYFGEHTPLEMKQSAMLSIPQNDKLWLISPPGSPPVGWEPIREDPPNMQTHAEDLLAALKHVAHQRDLEQQQLAREEELTRKAEEEEDQMELRTPGDVFTTTNSRLRTLFPASTIRLASAVEIALPTIAVEDWDDHGVKPMRASVAACSLVVPDMRASLPPVFAVTAPLEESNASGSGRGANAAPSSALTFSVTDAENNPTTPAQGALLPRTSIPPHRA